MLQCIEVSFETIAHLHLPGITLTGNYSAVLSAVNKLLLMFLHTEPKFCRVLSREMPRNCSDETGRKLSHTFFFKSTRSRAL